jgi:plasmid stabilization system protein ParE
MRATVSFSESALGDLTAIRKWYSEQGVPEVGERLVSEIVTQVEMLADHPDLGRVVPEFGQSTIREPIHPPFRIVYRRDLKRARVVRVWRSERLLRSVPQDEGPEA